jgi:hypothetical protein
MEKVERTGSGLGGVSLAAVLGVVLAVSLTPASARADAELTGWTCFGTDRCHAGSQLCCADPDTVEELTHCTTACPIGGG